MIKKEWDQELNDLLYELGYDIRDEFLLERQYMSLFMLNHEHEILSEAQLYIDFLEDCSDDYYLRIKKAK